VAKKTTLKVRSVFHSDNYECNRDELNICKYAYCINVGANVFAFGAQFFAQQQPGEPGFLSTLN